MNKETLIQMMGFIELISNVNDSKISLSHDGKEHEISMRDIPLEVYMGVINHDKWLLDSILSLRKEFEINKDFPLFQWMLMCSIEHISKSGVDMEWLKKSKHEKAHKLIDQNGNEYFITFQELKTKFCHIIYRTIDFMDEFDKGEEIFMTFIQTYLTEKVSFEDGFGNLQKYKTN